MKPTKQIAVSLTYAQMALGRARTDALTHNICTQASQLESLDLEVHSLEKQQAGRQLARRSFEPLPDLPEEEGQVRVCLRSV